MTLPSRLRWLWLTLAVVLLDRATKAWFESQTTEGWRHELIHNFVYLVHSRNPGLAFGILADSASTGTRILLIVGSALAARPAARSIPLDSLCSSAARQEISPIASSTAQ